MIQPEGQHQAMVLNVAFERMQIIQVNIRIEHRPYSIEQMRIEQH